MENKSKKGEMTMLRKKKRKIIRKIKNLISVLAFFGVLLYFVAPHIPYLDNLLAKEAISETIETVSTGEAKDFMENIKDDMLDVTNPMNENLPVVSKPLPNKNELVVSYIDVGQGDSVLIQLGDKAMLVDGGNNDKGTTVQHYLAKMGVNKLDVLISTHGDADHSGGLDVIAYKFDIDKCYMSYLDHDTKTYQEFKNVIAEKGVPVEYPLTNDSFKFGDADVIFVAPNEGEEETNLASLAFVLKYGNCTYFFGGDNEKVSYDGKVDVMMCPHHGSYTGNDIEEDYDFSYAVISVGENEYGHPHDTTMRLLSDKDCEIFRTDNGTVVSRCDGEIITFE